MASLQVKKLKCPACAAPLPVPAEADAAITGGRVGVQAKSNSKLTVNGQAARVAGEKVAVKAENNTELRMLGGLIESAGTALHLGGNAALHLRAGRIQGGTYAVVTGRAPKTFENEGAQLVGEVVEGSRATRRARAQQ